MKKTLGGDRLGSGNKMQVDLHGYERSTHDLGYLWRSTMAAGTLVPFMSEVALPGDTFDINLDTNIMTHPTVGPLFGSYKVQLDIFQAPIRLYNALLHNNKLGIGNNMEKVKFPVMNQSVDLMTDDEYFAIEDLDNCQVNPSCILSYLGIRGFGINLLEEEELNRSFNAIPYLAYWEIYKNYYSNKSEEIGAVINTPVVTLIETVDSIKIFNNVVEQAALNEFPLTSANDLQQGYKIRVYYTGAEPDPEQIYIKITDNNTYFKDHILPLSQIAYNWVDNGTHIEGTFNYLYPIGFTAVYWRYMEDTDLVDIAPKVQTFNLDNIDTMRENILASPSEVNAFDIFGTSLEPYIFIHNALGDKFKKTLPSQQGLAIKTYQSDMFNNWLQTEWIDGVNGISAITAVDTSSGEFTLDSLLLARKVYDMLNRIAVSGGTYDDWLDAVYTHDRYKRAESPIYCGGLSKELVFQEVVSNSETNDSPLGTLAGKGVLSKKHKGGHIVVNVDEPSYIIGIVSLTPRIDYSQGNKWDVHLKTMNDLHKPALDQIGFQELITEQMAWWDTSSNASNQWEQKSAGKQPAWINYMTNVNQTRGNFAIANNEMFMTLNRRYERQDAAITIKDLTTYIDPAKYNFIFAETALDAQNFWTQIAVDITARRKMSAKVMPNM